MLKKLNKKISFFNTVRRVEGVDSYVADTLKVMEINDDFGFSGMLLFQNNSNDLEPWILAQETFSKSNCQTPFVAINPAYAHPYYIAQKILSFSKLFKRKLYLNFIIGTAISDLESIGDYLSHKERYKRLTEYIEVLFCLLRSDRPINYDGKYYKINNLKLPSLIDEEYFPTSFIAGSSQEAILARERTNSSKLQMAKPLSKFSAGLSNTDGIYMGIIARSTHEEAMEILKEKFNPVYEEYEDILELSMLNTDAIWKKNLLEEDDDSVFRLEPFKHFNADCPYLVGSYEEVSNYIQKYIELGFHTFIIDTDVEEITSISKVLKHIDEIHLAKEV